MSGIRNQQLVEAQENASRPTPNDRPAGASVAGESLGPWLEAMRPRLVRLARRFVGQEHDAEEIAQDVLLIAWQQARGLRDPGKRNAWLYRITINQSLNRQRRRRDRPLETSGEQPGPSGAIQPGERDELAERLRTILGELPERQAAALVLREMEGLEYEQIAAILEARPAAVRILVHRGREAMRQALLRRWPETFG